jgi:hypothetical protein
MTLQAGKFSTLRTERAEAVRCKVQLGAPHFGAQCAEVHLARMLRTGTLLLPPHRESCRAMTSVAQTRMFC